jgi:hypothetical protein
MPQRIPNFVARLFNMKTSRQLLVLILLTIGLVTKVDSSHAQTSKAEGNFLFANDRIQVSLVYPNPATDYAEIDFQFTANVQDARVTFYNILGQEVKVIVLERDQRTVRIPMRDFNNGMYMYQLTIDGRSVATKKLIVRKGI